MKKSAQYTLIAVLLIVVAAFFLGEQTNAENIRDLMVDAVNGVKTYSIKTDIWIMTTGIADAENVDVLQTVSGTGATDILNRRMFQDSVIASISPDERDYQNIRIYFIENITYIFQGNESLVQYIPNSDLIWSKRTQIKQQADLLDNSDVELLPEEDGQYVLRVKPDSKKLVKYITSESIAGIDSPTLSTSQADKLASSIKHIDIVQWIEKESYLPSKFKMNILLEEGSIQRQTNITLYMSNYNEPVEIIPPESS